MIWARRITQSVLVGLGLHLVSGGLLALPMLLASDACCGAVIENVVAVLVIVLLAVAGTAIAALLVHFLVTKFFKVQDPLWLLTLISTLIGTTGFWLYWLSVTWQYLT